MHPLHHHGGVPACSPGASLGSLSDQVTLILPVVLEEPRLAGPHHPARPDPPLVAPRDHQEHDGDVRVFPRSINVARSHKDKGHRRLASSNYIDTENIIYMKSESMKIYLILLTFMRTPAPCS